MEERLAVNQNVAGSNPASPAQGNTNTIAGGIKMTKLDLIDVVAKKGEISKVTVAKVTDLITETIMEALADGEEVSIKDFAKFITYDRQARAGHDPNTGEPVEIKSAKCVRFKLFKKFKEVLNP